MPIIESVAAGAGLLSHLSYFIFGEHHLSAPRILRFYLVIILFLWIQAWRIREGSLKQASILATRISLSYFFSLFASIVTYRICFHRTSHFPGPFWAKVSKIYHALQITNSKQYLFLQQLNTKYGDFVRTGPNEITIFHPDAVTAIHGPSAECTKGTWYDNVLPKQSVVTTRSKAVHDARRRIWDQGFSIKALQQHEEIILDHACVLETVIQRKKGAPVNVSEYFECLGFDLMADIGYNRKFGMLESGQSHHAIKVFQGGISVLGTLTPIPWVIHVLFSLPLVTKGFEIYDEWATKELEERINIQIQPARQDTMGWLISETKKYSDLKTDFQWLLGDFITLVTGGTEPVIQSLVFLFLHLAQSPSDVAKLRKELHSVTSFACTTQMQALPHLRGLIYETLRLHPPVPSGGLRITPPEGIVVGGVGGTYIPGNTTVLVPHYSIQRREDCFVDAESFIPERWYERPEMVKNSSAFIPFGHGRFQCVGKNLGLMEIRTVTAVLIDKFDIAFAPGEDGIGVERYLKDCFAATPGPLTLVFTPRKVDGG